jgi:hypothetical protein
MKKLPTIEITELFMVKADWNRTFIGQIIRKTDEDGLSINLGNVTVDEGKIWSKAETQEELGKYLDDICTLKLDCNLHGNGGVTSILAETLFNHN